MHIVDLHSDDESAIHQVAALLVEGFATNWPEAWPDLETAREEVRESFGTGRISRVARDEDGRVLGWIGGISQYRGHVWELHPLVVCVSQQGKGIGRALVADLEERVKERGGLTITLGTDWRWRSARISFCWMSRWQVWTRWPVVSSCGHCWMQ